MFDLAVLGAQLYGEPSPTAAGAPSGDLADRLYSEPSASPAPAAAQGSRSDKAMSDALHPDAAAPPPLPVELPEHIKAERASPERRLYDAQQTYRDVLPDPSFETEGLPPETIREAMAEGREMLADMRASVAEAQTLVGLAQRLRKTPPSDEQRQAWRGQTMQALRAAHGDNAKRELDYAVKWIGQDPRRARLFANNGLGDHPQIVALAVELARRQRNPPA